MSGWIIFATGLAFADIEIIFKCVGLTWVNIGGSFRAWEYVRDMALDKHQWTWIPNICTGNCALRRFIASYLHTLQTHSSSSSSLDVLITWEALLDMFINGFPRFGHEEIEQTVEKDRETLLKMYQKSPHWKFLITVFIPTAYWRYWKWHFFVC